MDIQPVLKVLTSCPRGHSPNLEYEKDYLRNELKAGTLRYYCGECGDFWVPDLDHQKATESPSWRSPTELDDLRSANECRRKTAQKYVLRTAR